MWENYNTIPVCQFSVDRSEVQLVSAQNSGEQFLSVFKVMWAADVVQ